MGKVETKGWTCEVHNRPGDCDYECDEQSSRPDRCRMIPLISRAEFAADVAGRMERLLEAIEDNGPDPELIVMDLRALVAQIRKEGE